MSTADMITTTGEAVAEAFHHVSQLERKLVDAEATVERLRAQLGAGYKAVAEGGKIDSAAHIELSQAIATHSALEAMLLRANDALEKAKRRAFAAGVLRNAEQMRDLLQQRDELAREAEQRLAAFTEVLLRLMDNGALVLKNFGTLRGRNTSTPAGVIADLVGPLAQPAHLQHLTQLHLHRVTFGRWAYENVPPYGGPTFAQGVLGANGSLRAEFNTLMGIDDLHPEDVAALCGTGHPTAEQSAAEARAELGIN